ncbi:hypothetical protein FOZ60_005333 [Perkinsus olseni]|uniref:CDT1 Geminin-binding domain-containing protein n=1 Tax=Perkinsus olseni TaxID=32597 RepID=A0A7J6NTN8_PEROL|nr:hypothetical protein FOZ60_005333 [Perkinsus olseni]
MTRSPFPHLILILFLSIRQRDTASVRDHCLKRLGRYYAHWCDANLRQCDSEQSFSSPAYEVEVTSDDVGPDRPFSESAVVDEPTSMSGTLQHTPATSSGVDVCEDCGHLTQSAATHTVHVPIDSHRAITSSLQFPTYYRTVFDQFKKLDEALSLFRKRNRPPYYLLLRARVERKCRKRFNKGRLLQVVFASGGLLDLDWIEEKCTLNSERTGFEVPSSASNINQPTTTSVSIAVSTSDENAEEDALTVEEEQVTGKISVQGERVFAGVSLISAADQQLNIAELN